VNVKKDYHKVKIPTKLIYGDNDWANEKNREESQKSLVIKKFEVIKQCGHFSFQENPKKVASIICK
jgi:pimeloyl-ACP methyl ester carboxylesterase